MVVPMVPPRGIHPRFTNCFSSPPKFSRRLLVLPLHKLKLKLTHKERTNSEIRAGRIKISDKATNPHRKYRLGTYHNAPRPHKDQGVSYLFYTSDRKQQGQKPCR